MGCMISNKLVVLMEEVRLLFAPYNFSDPISRVIENAGKMPLQR